MFTAHRFTLWHSLSLAGLAAALTACGSGEKPLQNQPPLALLTCVETAQVGVPFSVDGSKSTDIDGSIASHTLLLDPLAEPSAELTGEVTPTRPGPLTIVLTVTDDKGAVSEARCRVLVTGELEENPTDPTDPTDPMDPSDPSDPTDPTDPTDPSDPIDPSDPSDPDPSTPPWHEDGATASARAYTVDCVAGWPTDWFDGTDVAEDILGFAWWSCGHDELHAADAMNTEFLHGTSPTGMLSSLPAMDDAPARGGDMVIVYATRMTPPEGATSVKVSVSGNDAVAVFARDFTVCGDGDDTDFCPIASANAEWANDIPRTERVPAQVTFAVSGAMDLEVRAASHEGAMSWNIAFEFFADGAPIEETAQFEAR